MTGGAPQTIVDAIEISRMLGIRYFWVDALCIIQQDQGTDFNAEGGKMLDYYGNSYVTISAAASKSAYDGIFLPRNSLHLSFEFPYTSRSGVAGNLTVFTLNPGKENIQVKYLLLEGENIITRGWTLQERVLSTRNIFYASDQMYYECNVHFLSEDGFDVKGRQSSTNPKTKEIVFLGEKKQNMEEMWDLLVQEYSGRSISYPDENKFIAFGGLAKKFTSLYGGDEYVAGLWRKKLVECLFWSVGFVDDSTKLPAWDNTWPPAKYRAPSWSWACMDCEVLNPDGRIYDPDILYAEVIDYKATPVHKENPYGGITDAYIKLHVPKLLPLEVKTKTDGDGNNVYKWYLSSSWDPNQTMGKISVPDTTVVDYQFSSRQLQKLDIYALVLARDILNSTDGINDVYYFCLLVTDNGHNAYRRLGIVWLDEKALGRHAPQKRPRSNWQDVRLE